MALGALLYANAFTDFFAALDGKESIRDNPHIRHLWPPSKALSLPLCGSVGATEQHATVPCRPTFSLVLGLAHHAFGLEPLTFHAASFRSKPTASASHFNTFSS